MAAPTLLPYRTFPGTYPHTFWPSVRNTVLNLIRPSHGTTVYRTVSYGTVPVPYSNLLYRTVPYRTVSCYHIVPYRSNAYGQRKYMSPARIDLASQPLNTADSQKIPVQKKCWVKVLEWTTPTLLAKSVGVGHPNTFFPTLFAMLSACRTVRRNVREQLYNWCS